MKSIYPKEETKRKEVLGDESNGRHKIRLIEMCEDRRFRCFYIVMCVNIKTIKLDKWVK